MKELVSVIIPTYKRPDRLTRAVKSVLEQTYNNFEILVIDDDIEGEPLDLEFFNNDEIRYLKNARTKGANGARNTGILHAKGAFIAFLDDDDEWLPNKLTDQIGCSALHKQGSGGIFGAYLNQNGHEWKPVNYTIESINLEQAIIDKVSIGSSSNIMIKKEVFEKVGLWDEELLRQQDLELLIRILAKYKMIFDHHISVKIYGHNKPNTLKAYQEREKYLKKIEQYLALIDKNSKATFLSTHYRRQTMYLLELNRQREAWNQWKESRKVKPISFKKDLKILLLYLKSLLMFKKN